MGKIKAQWLSDFPQCLCESLEATWNTSSSHPLAWRKLRGAVFQPMWQCPGAAWGIPHLVRLTKISSHFVFHLWLSVCSCVLSTPTNSHCYFSLLLVEGGKVKDVRLGLKRVKRAITTPKTELMSNIQRKGVVIEWSRKKG